MYLLSLFFPLTRPHEPTRTLLQKYLRRGKWLFLLLFSVVFVCCSGQKLLAQQPLGYSGRTLTIGIEAFIPNDLAITRRIGGTGKYSGRTGLAGPFKSIIDSIASGEPAVSNECFLDDDRSWRTRDNQSARVRAEVTIDIDTLTVLDRVRRTYDSEWVWCNTGNLIRSRNASADRVKWNTVSRHLQSRDNLLLTLSAEAANGALTWQIPLAGERSIAPDIDYSASVNISVVRDRDRSVRVIRVVVTGQVDQFPAYEAWARLNQGAYERFAGRYPGVKKTPANLYTSINPQLPLNGIILIDVQTGAVQKIEAPELWPSR